MGLDLTCGTVKCYIAMDSPIDVATKGLAIPPSLSLPTVTAVTSHGVARADIHDSVKLYSINLYLSISRQPS